MEAFECDICKKLYKKYYTDEKPYSIEIEIIERACYSRKLDLCEECHDKIVNMIQNKEYK